MTTFTFIPTANINTTTGEPNKITGRHSIHGQIVVGRVDARNAVTGGRAKMRQFCLGQSVADFNEYMDHVESLAPTKPTKPSKMNYRHSLRAMNEFIAHTGHKLTVTGENGKLAYTLYEKDSASKSGWGACGHYYRAQDAAEICNMLVSKI